ncbi:MAG TPA: hypothetical protein VN441_11330 [Syntrophomonas sp.]|nr:hypothetical protein [Syntrophomonas sp.]
MIIGIDIDNTITHTTEMILHYATIFGQKQGLNTVPDLNHYYLEDILGWDKKVADDFLVQRLCDIYSNMRAKDQAAEVIRELKKQHQIILITSRNQKFPAVQEVTADWLSRNEIEYDRLILNKTSNMHYFSKLDACLSNGVEVMIEDHHQLVSELSAQIPVIMFEYPYNRHLQHENIIHVNHWREVADWLEQYQPRHISNVG